MIGEREAREHLAMLDRIVERRSQRLRVGAEYWGIAEAIQGIGIAGVAGLLAVAFSLWLGRCECNERLTLLERELFAVLRVAMGVTLFVFVIFVIEIFGPNLFCHEYFGFGAVELFAASRDAT